ncbi:hypothetical protein MGN70_013788 [Eutypa lata]|nr:hypothetical protein MGN70_013788 [Eutypa lata]
MAVITTCIILLVLFTTFGQGARLKRGGGDPIPSEAPNTTTPSSISSVTVYVVTTTSPNIEGAEAEGAVHDPNRTGILSLTSVDSGYREVLGDVPSFVGDAHENPTIAPFLPGQTSSQSISNSTISSIASASISSKSPDPVQTSLSSVSPPSQEPTLPIPTGHFATNCILYYQVQEKDTCLSIGGDFRISLDKLLNLNPELDPRCEHLQTGQVLCLREVAPTVAVSSSTTRQPTTTTPTPTSTSTGAITISRSTVANTVTTTSPISTGAPSTLISSSSSSSSSSSNGTVANATTTTTTTNPQQPPSLENCTRTYSVKAHDTCDGIARSNKLTLGDFLSLNPALRVRSSGRGSGGNCPIDIGQVVCVQGGSPSQNTRKISSTSFTKHTAHSSSATRIFSTSGLTHPEASHVPTSLEVIPIETRRR